METNNQNNQPLSIFDISPANISSFARPDWGNGTNFYDPKPADCKDKIYRAIIRVLPNVGHPSIPIVCVKYYWFNEGNNTGFRYNSPSSPNYEPANPAELAKPIGYCPVSSLYWELKRSNDARLEEIAAREYSIQSNYICLVQIKQDFANPENNGKIMPYKLPAVIYKKINDALNPKAEDIAMGAVAKDILHPINGYDIMLKIGLKDVNGRQMRDYELCSIADKPSSIAVIVDGQQFQADLGKYEADSAYASNVREQIVTMLKEQPDVFVDHGYKESTDDIKRRVKQYMSRHTDVTNIWPDLAGVTVQSQTANTTAANVQPTVTAQSAIDPFASQPVEQQPQEQQQPVEQQAAATPTDAAAQFAESLKTTTNDAAGAKNPFI